MPEYFTHYNSEREKVTIETVPGGDFAGQYMLIIHDDPPLSVQAPMLLDEGTARWLVDVIGALGLLDAATNGGP